MNITRAFTSLQDVQRGARRHPVAARPVATAVFEAARVTVDRLGRQRVPDRDGRLVDERAHAAVIVAVAVLAVIVVVTAAATVVVVAIAIVGVEIAEAVVMRLEAHVGRRRPVLRQLRLLAPLLRDEGQIHQTTTQADHLARLLDDNPNGRSRRTVVDDASEEDRLLRVLARDIEAPVLAVVLRLRAAAIGEDDPTVDLGRRHQTARVGRHELGRVDLSANASHRFVLGLDLHVRLAVAPPDVVIALLVVAALVRVVAAVVIRRKLGHVILHRFVQNNGITPTSAELHHTSGLPEQPKSVAGKSWMC